MPDSAHCVVVDTNIWFSAFLRRGQPLVLINALAPAGFQCVSSPVLIEELRETLQRKSGWPAAQVDSVIALVTNPCILVEPTITVAACRDPDDNRVLECAIEANAGYIVSGDKDLLSLGTFNGVAILTVRQFLDSLPI